MKLVEQGPQEVQHHKAKIKHVLLAHLNAAYYCKKHIVDFLLQIEGKTELAELKRLIGIYLASSHKQIDQLERLYDYLKAYPDESMLTGIKSYTMEALIAIVKSSKKSFEKGLTILNYLQIVNAIDSTYVKILNRMVKAIGIPDTYLLGSMININTSIASLERITEKYMAEETMIDSNNMLKN